MVKNIRYLHKEWISSNNSSHNYLLNLFIVSLILMINLYEYVSSYDIITHITTPCTIISDHIPNIIFPDHIHFFPLSHIFENDLSSRTEPCVLITHQLTNEDYSVLKKHLPSGFSWINLHPWVRSMINKNNPEINDIVQLLGQHYTVIEPIDINHLLINLQPHTYMRIHDTFLPETLSSYHREDWFTKSMDSDSHSDYVILTTPAHSDSVASAVHTLSQDPNFLSDLYIQHTFSTTLSAELIKDIQRTQHVIVIIDHKATEEIWMYYDTLLKEQTGLKDINIQYIFPQFHLVSSILPEYIYEESQFDQQSFLAYLSSRIQEKL